MTDGGAPSRENIIRFQDFELDLSRQTLSRRGIRLKLQNQPCQVLTLLIQRAPAIVSRDEIRRQVWGDNVYIDVERSINFCIRQVRGVLLDNAAAPRFVETLPREGYRFIAPLQGSVENEMAGQNGSVPVKEDVADVIVSRRRSPPLIGLIALLGVVAAATIAFWLLRRDVQIKVSEPRQ